MKLTKGKLIFLITFACITLAILLTRFTSKNATECVPSEVTITCENNLVSLSSETYCSIYYTVDGSIPSADSILYTGPFELKKVAMLCSASDSIAVGDYSVLDGEVPVANVIRAIAIAPDGTCSNVVTCTCFDREQDLTVISMIIDYDDLLDYETGIMVKGKIYDEWASTPEASDIVANKVSWRYEGNYTQHGKEWERQALLDIYDSGNHIQIPAGVRIQGHASRAFPQRSFNIYFREKYGAKRLDYDLFGNGITEYKSLTLRNGGNDADRLKFKDAWIQSRLTGLDFATQSSKPAILYINGEYWGIYNLQEKYSDVYIKEHFDIEDDIVMIKEGELEEGDQFGLYEELLQYSEKDLTDEETWAKFKSIMDVQSMADYYAAQIYIGNGDFGQESNCALWRSVSSGEGPGDGRWRFMLYDTEYSSSMYGEDVTSSGFNSYKLALENSPLFASAMKNDEFRSLYLQSLENVKTRFRDETVAKTLNDYLDLWEPHMDAFYSRFGDSSWGYDYHAIQAFFHERSFTVLNDDA